MENPQEPKGKRVPTSENDGLDGRRRRHIAGRETSNLDYWNAAGYEPEMKRKEHASAASASLPQRDKHLASQVAQKERQPDQQLES